MTGAGAATGTGAIDLARDEVGADAADAADTDDAAVPRTIRAAGAVLWRPAGGGAGTPAGTADVEVAVVHRPHRSDWSLPKGKVDPGESRARTAVRELAEETGYDAELSHHLATVRYPLGEDRKVVDYWVARPVGGGFAPNDEVDELRWLPPAEAARLLTYASDRDVLTAFTDGAFPVVTLLLVRHAKAGKRGSCDDDDARPLVGAGREQAAAIADLLTAHGVRRFHAVPRTRCRQTLEPAAHSRGAAVTDEAAFADEAVAGDLTAARDRLLALAAAQGGTAALCAQGEGIPALVRALAVPGDPAPADAGPRPEIHSNRRLSDPPSRKASVWVLTFGRTAGTGEPEGPAALRLVAADYVRDPAV